jgi:hypothetical protein
MRQTTAASSDPVAPPQVFIPAPAGTSWCLTTPVRHRYPGRVAPRTPTGGGSFMATKSSPPRHDRTPDSSSGWHLTGGPD